MASKFFRPALSTTFSALDSGITEESIVTIMNDGGQVVRVVDAADASAAATLDTGGTYMQLASSASVVWKFRCKPARTFMKTEAGGVNLRVHIETP